MLHAAGGLRRREGLQSSRQLRIVQQREVPLDEALREPAPPPIAREHSAGVLALCENCKLTPREADVLWSHHGEEEPRRDIATRLGVSLHEVNMCLDRAVEKSRAMGPDALWSACALYWEEVRQKSAALYRKPSGRWQQSDDPPAVTFRLAPVETPTDIMSQRGQDER